MLSSSSLFPIPTVITTSPTTPPATMAPPQNNYPSPVLSSPMSSPLTPSLPSLPTPSLSNVWRSGITSNTSRFLLPSTQGILNMVQKLMSSDTKYKYAIVRLPETSVVDFFSLIVPKGYSDVSFVASLQQCNMKDDPNDDQPTTSSSVKETQSNDDDSTSENNKSSPPRRQSSVSQISTPVKAEPFESWTPTAPSSNPTPDLLSGSVPAELLTNLFAKKTNGSSESKTMFGFQASGVDFDLSNNEWHDNLKMSNGQHSIDKFHPYAQNSKNDSPLQTRMKGWQREYIKEIIKDSHYPTEEELRDIELKCDLSRKQILRFIAKRLTNPNRKPRINHLDEKRKEQEERESFGGKDDDEEGIQDMNGLHHILSSLQETTA